MRGAEVARHVAQAALHVGDADVLVEVAEDEDGVLLRLHRVIERLERVLDVATALDLEALGRGPEDDLLLALVADPPDRLLDALLLGGDHVDERVASAEKVLDRLLLRFAHERAVEDGRR